MRLATIATAQGPRLHVRGRSGYVDVADGTGDPRMSSLTYVLDTGEPAMGAIRPLETQDGREAGPADFAAAVPAPPRILCLGLNYSEHALEGGRAVLFWAAQDRIEQGLRDFTVTVPQNRQRGLPQFGIGLLQDRSEFFRRRAMKRQFPAA